MLNESQSNPFVALQQQLESLPANQLVSHMDAMRSHEREQLVEYLHYLAAVDRRDISLELGFPSLWAFCVEHQRHSNGTAYRRIAASRLLGRFPAIASYLASGQLCLTTLCLLKDVMDETNHREILARAAGRTEEQVKVLVATLRPEDAPADLLRRLPTAKPAQVLVPATAEEPSLGASGETTSGPEVTPPALIASGPEARSALPPGREPDRVRPINADQHVLRVTIGAECRAELEQVIRALSHKVPSGNLEAVLRECFKTTLKACARRRGLVDRPRARKEPPLARGGSSPSRHVPAADRRTVWLRDEANCTFVGSDGRRCSSRHQLELDHNGVPFAAGGLPTAANLTLHCRAHNQYRARNYFGAAFMARFRRRSNVPEHGGVAERGRDPGD